MVGNKGSRKRLPNVRLLPPAQATIHKTKHYVDVRWGAPTWPGHVPCQKTLVKHFFF